MKRIITIIVLILLLISSISTAIYFRKQFKRMASNFQIANSNLQKAFILHKNELSDNFKQIDSLRKELGIRSKTVQTVFQTKYNYRDSLLYLISDSLRIKDSINYINITIPRHFTLNKNCYSFSFDKVKDSLQCSFEYHDVLTGLLHWERPHKFLFIHWGPKEYFLKLYSECQKDTMKVDKLILIQ